MSDENTINFILYPLLIIIVISSFTQFYYYGNVIFSSSESQNQSLISSQTLNGTEQELELENADLDLTFDMQNGLILIVIASIALGLIGIQVLSSGLGEKAQKIIWNGIVYYGLWVIFSIMSYNTIVSIPIFGVLLWFIFTFFYSFGVFNKMG